MTEDERRMVIQLLRDAGLVIVSSSLLPDGTMTVRVKRIPLAR
jgi:hypothetical protein